MDLIRTLVVDMSAPFSATIIACVLGFYVWTIVRRMMRMTEQDKEDVRESRRASAARQIARKGYDDE